MYQQQCMAPVVAASAADGGPHVVDCCRECWELAAGDVIVSAERRRLDHTQLYSVVHSLRSVSLTVFVCFLGVSHSLQAEKQYIV